MTRADGRSPRPARTSAISRTSSPTCADRVLHLRVDRVERRNAFTQDMYRGHEAGRDLGRRARRELDAVCLTGTGEWFGAGGDMAGRSEDPEGLAAEWDATDHFPFRHIERCRKLWVAKINGLCHAGGLDLALHCDVPIASDRARFRVPELLRGIPDPFMSARLARRVAWPRPGACCSPPPRSTPPQAEAIGLVGEAVPHDELDATVEWVLEQIRRTGPRARPRSSATSTPSSRRPTSRCSGPGLVPRDDRGHGRLRREASRRLAPPEPSRS